ncbi:MAG: hypothetical protein H7256_09300, partial [Bdellovibrio sp.]|nr:hypothetical protein [Bdellovibrio sp.]
MEINNIKTKQSSFERKTLLLLSVLFLATIAGAWFYTITLSKNIAAKNEIVNVDTRALIEVERIRNLAESQIDNSLSFFLLGAGSLFEEQKKDKQNFLDSLAAFEKQYSLTQVPDLVKRMGSLEQQQQDIFDQAMDFRAKQTESKIVGQFYRAKTTPIRNNMNRALDEIAHIHKAELEHNQVKTMDAASYAQAQIPISFAWFAGAVSFLFFCLSLVVIRVLSQRSRQLAERSRLYNEA